VERVRGRSARCYSRPSAAAIAAVLIEVARFGIAVSSRFAHGSERTFRNVGEDVFHRQEKGVGDRSPTPKF